MRNLLVLFLGILGGFSTFAQQREVLSSAGDKVQVNGTSVSYTLGEPVVAFASNDTASLASGFQQSNIIISNALPRNEIGVQAKIYPNPAVNFFYLELEKKDDAGFFIVLHNTQGQFVFRKSVHISPMQVSLAGYPKGVYYLTLLNASNERLHQFKVVKTE